LPLCISAVAATSGRPQYGAITGVVIAAALLAAGFFLAVAPALGLPLPPTRAEYRAARAAKASRNAGLIKSLERLERTLEEHEARAAVELEQGHRVGNSHFFFAQALRNAVSLAKRAGLETIGEPLQRLAEVANADKDAMQAAVDADAAGGDHWAILTSADQARLERLIERSREARQAVSGARVARQAGVGAKQA